MTQSATSKKRKTRQHAKHSWIQQGGPPLVVILLVLLLWQGYVTLFHVESWLLPSPWQILQTFTDVEVLQRLGLHTRATLIATLLGLGIGTVFGIFLAFLLHLIPILKRGIYPLLIVSQNIPIIALGPLLVIWFGFGLLPKVILIALVCFFPIVVATLNGLTHPDPNLLNYFHMIGANRREQFRYLELPNAMNYLFSGLKIAATYSVLTAVVAEWFGAKQGLGIFIRLSANNYLTHRVFAAILIIVGLSLALVSGVYLCEKYFLRWQFKKGEHTS